MIPGSDCPISKILSILSSATYNFLHKPHMYPGIAYSKIIQLKMWGFYPTLGMHSEATIFSLGIHFMQTRMETLVLGFLFSRLLIMEEGMLR